MGYAYAFLDEPFTYSDIFTPSKELIENENLQKLISAEILYEEPLGETWYKNPENYLLKIECAAESLFLKDGEIFEVEITGKELLEVLEDDQETIDKNSKE